MKHDIKPAVLDKFSDLLNEPSLVSDMVTGCSYQNICQFIELSSDALMATLRVCGGEDRQSVMYQSTMRTIRDLMLIANELYDDGLEVDKSYKAKVLVDLVQKVFKEKSENKIHAIKEVRSRYGYGLRDAKDIVELITGALMWEIKDISRMMKEAEMHKAMPAPVSLEIDKAKFSGFDTSELFVTKSRMEEPHKPMIMVDAPFIKGE